MIESPNFEDKVSFEKIFQMLVYKCPLRFLNGKNNQHLINLMYFLSKLHVIFPEDIYHNIINNSPKPCPSSTRNTKMNS